MSGAGYLGTGRDLFAIQDLPQGTPSGTAVLLCPPFGWEALAARRALRRWGRLLAGDGHLAVRIDLPGTGDSPGSPHDPGLLTQWVAALADAAAVLAGTDGVQSVAALGLGLGGLLALEAVRAGAPFDELALWATPRNGRRAIRELQAFAAFEELPQPDDGGLLAGGYLMTAETRAQVALIDPAQWHGHTLDRRRVLLLGRDGDPEPAFGIALERAGGTVSAAAAGGYGAMTGLQTFGALPQEPARRVASWLSRPGTGRRPQVALRTQAAMAAGAVTVTERPVALPVGDGRTLFAVRTDPAGAPATRTVVFLNAGRLDHTGPNRLWVELARGAAAAGVAALRLDGAGIGESGGDDDPSDDPPALFAEHHIDDLVAALAAADGTAVCLVGLCSGGAWALRAGARVPAVDTVVAINPRAILEPDARAHAEAARRVTRVTERRAWRHLWRDRRLVPRLVLATLVGLVRHGWDLVSGGPRRRTREVDAMLDTLAARGATVVFAFSGSEPLDDDYRQEGRWAALGRWPGVRRVSLDLGRERHELRPLALQRRAHELVGPLAAPR